MRKYGKSPLPDNFMSERKNVLFVGSATGPYGKAFWVLFPRGRITKSRTKMIYWTPSKAREL